MLEHELRHLGFSEVLRLDQVEFPHSRAVILAVKQVQAIVKADLGDKFRVRISPDVICHHRLVAFLLEAYGAQSPVPLGHHITCR